MGLPGYNTGIDCSDPDPSRWTWISTEPTMPADIPADVRPWLPSEHPHRGLTRQ